MNYFRFKSVMILLVCFLSNGVYAMKILNFQADNGFQHPSKKAALKLIQDIAQQNEWEVVSTTESSSLTELDLSSFDVIVFNNNCGNKGAVMNSAEQLALQKYVQNGGAFLGVHCAGALWKEGGEFQAWYEGLIGTRMVDHPRVQTAELLVEDNKHIATRHLPQSWIVKDEWHRFSSNPREKVDVLVSVNEDSYEGKQKMGGDHPFIWCHEYDGGRSFFTSLGHTKEVYQNENFIQMIEGALFWLGEKEMVATELPVTEGLMLDLDADKGVQVEDGDKVKSWANQILGNGADVFVKRDKGRKVKGSGRPELKKDVVEIGGHRTIVFREQELVNMDEDVFDHLITGDGYTWFSVMSVYEQIVGKKDVNSFFGNLRNGNPYEGFWGCLMDDNRMWMGSRNGMPKKSKGLWSKGNPLVVTAEPLEEHRYYLAAGRMQAGQGSVALELYLNSAVPVDKGLALVNPEADASLMAIGQERDATNHPGKESFSGEIARFLIYDRALSNSELEQMMTDLKKGYQIK